MDEGVGRGRDVDEGQELGWMRSGEKKRERIKKNLDEGVEGG